MVSLTPFYPSLLFRIPAKERSTLKDGIEQSSGFCQTL
jgi:hypothetical protein